MQTSSTPVSERQAVEHPASPETVEDALMSLMMALGRRVRQRQPGDMVDFSAFPILKVLSHHGPMRLSGLAHALGLDASTVSRHARQLEDRGLLERTDDPDDRRASRVAVSQRGQDCLASVFEARRELITHSLDGLSGTERDTLRDLLDRLVQNLTSTQETEA
jgi:DNA-binding MarR family transcriptional regulator